MSNLLKSKLFVGVMIASAIVVGVAMFAFAFVATTDAANCSITTTLRVGSRGDQVKCLQSELGIGADGIFGKMTKAAVVSFQASKGLVADGIFGAKSRAAWSGGSAMTPSSGTLCPNGMTLASNCTMAPSTTPVVSSGPVSAMLATDNPASRSVVATEAGADLAHFTFTGSGTVTNVTLKRVGVSADASLSNVYLYDGAVRLTDAASVSNNSMINFNDPNGLFAVNGSKTISVRVDMAGSAGETVGVALVGFTSMGQSAVTLGTPMSGNVMTVATASLAGVSFGSVTPGSNANLTPEKDVVVWQSTASVITRDVWLTRFTVREVGSIGKADLNNLRLLVDATTVATVANPDNNGYVTFAPSAPLKLITGSHTFKVIADVTGGSSLTFTFSIRNRTDIGLVDSQYNVGFLTSTAVGSLAAGQQTISTGYVTVQKATNSPTSTIVLSGTDVVLGRFTAQTYGENVKVDTMLVDFTSNQTAKLRNGRILVDGQQVGSTATIDPASTGTSFNVNHTFMAGTTAVIEVRADIFDNDGTGAFVAGDTIKVTLSTGVNNAQGMVSGDASLDVPTSDVDASTLSIGTGSITLAKDQSYGDQSAVVPTTGTLLGSWTLTSGTTEALNIDTIQVDLGFAGDFGAADLSNVYVMYGSKSTSSKSTVSASAGANSWNISESMPVNTSMTFKVYGDIASGAVVTAGGDTVQASLLVSGTSASGTAVNTNSNAVLAGQTISAVSSGVLTVSLDTNTPTAAQAVAGTTPAAGSLKIKLAGTNEDQYVKTVKIMVGSSANSVAISSLNLSWSPTSNGTYATVGTDQTLTNDGTIPGYSTWNLTGGGRVTVPKNGSVYLKVTPTYVSSGQTEVSGKTPKLLLANLEAEGTSILSASGTGGNLVNASGIVLVANSSSTFVSSTETKTAATISASTTTVPTANGIVFAPGDIIFIDANADSTWDPATEELMVVLVDGGVNLTVQRGSYGTTAVAYDADADTIYRLSGTVASQANASIIGNATTVLETKLSAALASNSPSGAFTGGTGKYLFGVTFSAANNVADSATNTATINYIDVTVSKSAATVANLKAYPEEQDNNSTYATTCGAISSTKWRCTLSSVGSTNTIDENASRTYYFRGDLGYSGAGSVDFSLAALGTSDVSTNSVSWSDGAATPTTVVWVNQPTTTIQGGSLTTTAASGSADSTAPVLSTIVVASGGSANTISSGDTITLTWNEPIDASTVNASLLPGSSVAGVSSGTSFLTANAADAVLTLANITTFDSGASITALSGNTQTIAMNSASTTLTITVTGSPSGGVITTPALGAGTTVAGTIKDANGTAQASVASPVPTGSF